MKKLRYNYQVINLTDGGEVGYTAIIPKFPGMHIYADTISELHDVIEDTINWEIKDRRKNNRPIPPPDTQSKFKGKVLLRIEPELHEKLYFEAKANGKSLNKYITEKLN